MQREIREYLDVDCRPGVRFGVQFRDIFEMKDELNLSGDRMLRGSIWEVGGNHLAKCCLDQYISFKINGFIRSFDFNLRQ